MNDMWGMNSFTFFFAVLMVFFTSSILAKDLLEGMVLVPEGAFAMGTEKGTDWERPVHVVKLSAFFIDRYEVINSQYEVFDPEHRRSNRSFCDHCPVTLVTWEEADAYCKSRKARLPTEAEWERAALGGADQPDKPILLDSGQIRYEQAFNAGTGSVNSLEPNRFGLYHMRGNVWEWINDWFGSYSKEKSMDASGPKNGTRRIVRGGSWYSSAYYVNSRMRFRLYPKTKLNSLGFRCVADAH